MKTINFKSIKMGVLLILLVMIVPGCIVISFYPLYEKDDLFANDLLTGSWIDNDSSVWNFDYPVKKIDKKNVIDSLSYLMKLRLKDGSTEKSTLKVHVVNIDDIYYLDFYLEDYEPYEGERDDFLLFDLHMMKVHTFARLTLWGDSALIQWFDPSWLEEQFDKSRVRIRHEDNDKNILLTAKPSELQKFVKKYGHIEEAYDTDLMLYRIH